MSKNKKVSVEVNGKFIGELNMADMTDKLTREVISEFYNYFKGPLISLPNSTFIHIENALAFAEWLKRNEDIHFEDSGIVMYDDIALPTNVTMEELYEHWSSTIKPITK